MIICDKCRTQLENKKHAKAYLYREDHGEFRNEAPMVWDLCNKCFSKTIGFLRNIKEVISK